MLDETTKLLTYAYNLSLYYGHVEVQPRFLLFAGLGCPNPVVQAVYAKFGLTYDKFVSLEVALYNDKIIDVESTKYSDEVKAIKSQLDELCEEGRIEGSAVDLLAITADVNMSKELLILETVGVSRFNFTKALMYEQDKFEEALIEEQLTADQPFIRDYCKDLSNMAKLGEIDPLIGRSKEMDRVIQVLGRRRKNNPVILGPAGVGKTALVEGLALAIHNKEERVKLLHGKRIVTLDLHLALAGTKYRGQFEERVVGLVKELEEDPDTIVFIDELHNIVGAGNCEGATNDAANMFKPALARGAMQIIGATTKDEYKYVKSDPALERRFQPVELHDLTDKEIYDILKGLRKVYGKYHECSYTVESIKACIKLGKELTDRNSPDVEIDLMDEVGSRYKGEQITKRKVEAVFKQQIQSAQKKRIVGF